jgi:hypothetical protein
MADRQGALDELEICRSDLLLHDLDLDNGVAPTLRAICTSASSWRHALSTHAPPGGLAPPGRDAT